MKVLNKRFDDAPADGVYIGRGSKWGNPFRIGQDGDRATVIAKYERWLSKQMHLFIALDELKGRDLVCFCAPAACHGDLLLRLASMSREDRLDWMLSQHTNSPSRSSRRTAIRPATRFCEGA